MSTQDTQSHDFNSLEQGKTTKKSTDKSQKVFHRKSDAVKALEELKFQNIKYKYPTFRFPPKPKYSDSTTNGLTKCVIEFIHLNGFQAERVNSTGFLKDNRKTSNDILGRSRTVGSTKWIPGNGQTGTADISCTIKGLSLKIEIKCAASGDHKQSKEQIEYQKQIEASGGVYLIIRTFSDFYEWFNNASL